MPGWTDSDLKLGEQQRVPASLRVLQTCLGAVSSHWERTVLPSLQAQSLTPALAGTQAVIQNGIGVDKFDPKQ